jgi:hypothetical protein
LCPSRSNISKQFQTKPKTPTELPNIEETRSFPNDDSMRFKNPSWLLQVKTDINHWFIEKGGLGMRARVEMRIKLPIKLVKKAKWYVASCPALDVVT